MAERLGLIDSRGEASDYALEALTDGCLTIAQATRFSGLSRSTLYEAMDRGELPFVKIGRRRLLPRLSLVRWLGRGLHGGNVA